MKKILAAALLLIATVLSSCSSANSNEAVTLTFWTTTTGAESEFFQQKIEAFQLDHPNIKVDLVEVPFSAASNQFKTAILGDQSIDIFRSDSSWISEFADLGILYPLTNLITDEELSGFMESAISTEMYKGELYGLPSVIDAPALLYNKRILKEVGYTSPPQSMDELLEIAKSVTKDNQYGIFVSNDGYYAMPYVWAFGGGTISDDRKIEITSEDTIKGLEFMLQLRQEGVSQPYKDFTNAYNMKMDDFKSGKSAMIINGPWAVADILTGSEFKDATNLGIAQIPKGPKGQGSPIGGHGLVISKYSNAPEEAYELIRYLTSAETQLQQSLELKTLPTQSKVYEDPALGSDSIIQGFKAQLDAARAKPLIPEAAQMFTDFTSNLTDILLERQTVEEGVTNIETAWKSLMRVK